MRPVLLLAFLLAACDDTGAPDDSCFVEGTSAVTVTLEPDRDDIETSDLAVTVADCLDSRAEATAAAGEIVEIDGPSAGELVITVTGTWAGGVHTGTCTGEAIVVPGDGGDAEVTVPLACVTTAWAAD